MGEPGARGVALREWKSYVMARDRRECSRGLQAGESSTASSRTGCMSYMPLTAVPLEYGLCLLSPVDPPEANYMFAWKAQFELCSKRGTSRGERYGCTGEQGTFIDPCRRIYCLRINACLSIIHTCSGFNIRHPFGTTSCSRSLSCLLSANERDDPAQLCTLRRMLLNQRVRDSIGL